MAVFMYRINQQGKLAIEGLRVLLQARTIIKLRCLQTLLKVRMATVTIPTTPGKNTDDKDKSSGYL